jgi:hypothetical protein
LSANTDATELNNKLDKGTYTGDAVLDGRIEVLESVPIPNTITEEIFISRIKPSNQCSLEWIESVSYSNLLM